MEQSATMEQAGEGNEQRKGNRLHAYAPKMAEAEKSMKSASTEFLVGTGSRRCFQARIRYLQVSLRTTRVLRGSVPEA